MYEDIYPEKKKKPTVTVTDYETGEVTDEYEVDIDKSGNIKRTRKKPRKKINLYPKGQTLGKRAKTKASKKARETMKRAMKIRKYIKEDEKDKE